MSAAPEVINPQNVAEIAQSWKGVHSVVRKDLGKGPSPCKLSSGDASSSSDELNTKVRKPYTITKQRERWTEIEHQKFLEALKLYGRAWRSIEEYIGTKTAVQLEREASTGSSAGKLPEIAIPPPRPKRKPNHPYPKKAGSSPSVLEEESKETSSLSSPRIIVGDHSEGFQSGSFKPCMSQGLGSGTGALIHSPRFRGHSFGPEGSVKISGKTVVFPGTSNQAVQSESSNACLGSKDASFLGMESSVAEPKQVVGFSPFTKFIKSVNIVSEAPLHLGRNGFNSGATHSEDSGESLGRSPKYGLAGGDIEAVDNGECNVDAASPQKVEKGLSTVCLKEAEKLDMQFSHMPNPAMQSWMNNFVQYHSSSSIPSIPAVGVVDGPSGSSLSYWQFMQASAVNYAAYTTAMAAAAAASWKLSNPGGTAVAEFAKSSKSEPQLPCLPSPWCPFRGVVPSLYFPAPRVFHQGEGFDSCENGKALGNEKMMGVSKDTPPHGQADTELKEPETQQNNVTFQRLDSGADAKTIDSCTHRSGSTSCLTKTSRNPKACPDTDSQLNAEAMLMLLKVPTKCSDTERTSVSHLLQITYSSSDEVEEQGKKPGEGSSSGSNTPASRYQPSEYDAPVETKKRDSDTLFEDNDDCEGLQASHHQHDDLPKLGLKHAEKGRKHPQRDARHGGWYEDSKRFKSCALDLELRKEVSQGGRKAFQALFTSKLLPQTFPSANLVSRPTVSTVDESRSNECINSIGVSQGGADLAAVDVEMGNEFQGLKGQSMVNSKGFTVSSSSGFVPYRRLVCPEPMNLDQSCSL